MKLSNHPVVLTTVGSFHPSIVRRLEIMGAKVIVAKGIGSATRDYAKATHVLIPGGADVHPANYNQPVTYSYQPDTKRDLVELVIADLAIIDHKPLFGICRGHQIITIAAGGNLFQDIYAETGIPHGYMSHMTTLAKRGLLYKFSGSRPNLWTNSYHHQSVRTVPPGWFVAAKSSDGVVEAIGHPKLPVISVQWHPEAMMTESAISIFSNWLKL